MNTNYSINKGNGSVVATAIHNGHQIREALHGQLNLSETQRLREEDPFTADWTSLVPTSIIVNHSRFELDVNRPREKAVYQTPDDAWGLQVWQPKLPDEVVNESLRYYDQFYKDVKALLDEKIKKYGYFILYDLHTYNHKREGPTSEVADPETNPEVNIGTKHIEKEKWAPVVDTFIHTMKAFDYNGRSLDVRENVKFGGGYFVKWIHDNYGGKCCAMAIEFKKFFMDEWTGKLDNEQHALIGKALQTTLPAVLESANTVNHK